MSRGKWYNLSRSNLVLILGMESCSCIIYVFSMMVYSIFASSRTPSDYPISLEYSGDKSRGTLRAVLPSVKGEYKAKAFTVRRARGWRGSIFEVSLPLELPSPATILIKPAPHIDLRDYKLRYTHEKNMKPVFFINTEIEERVDVSSTDEAFAKALLDQDIQAEITGFASGIIIIRESMVSFLDRGLFFRKSNRAERILKLLHNISEKLTQAN